MDHQKRLKEFGPWSEQTSSSGKRYYYNRETEVSQWEKPTEWRDYERALTENVIAPSSSNPENIRTPNVRQISNQQSSIKQLRFDREERKKRDETVTNTYQSNKGLSNHDQSGGTPQSSTFRQEKSDTQKTQDDEFRKYARYARPELISHLKGWKGDVYANEARKVHQNVNNLSNQINNIDSDIKTVQSLVYIAETKSKLLNRKLQFVRQQLEQLENSNVINVPSMNS